jgi:hypothetical protein
MFPVVGEVVETKTYGRAIDKLPVRGVEGEGDGR